MQDRISYHDWQQIKSWDPFDLFAGSPEKSAVKWFHHSLLSFVEFMWMKIGKRQSAFCILALVLVMTQLNSNYHNIMIANAMEITL